MYFAIGQHPDIWMPPVKELHFFNSLFSPRDRKWTAKAVEIEIRRLLKRHLTQGGTGRRNLNQVRNGKPNYDYLRYLIDFASRSPFTEEWYRRIFDWPAASGKITGDITPAYSTLPARGVFYVKHLLPEVRIVYIIRDPLERALSQIRMTASRYEKLPAEHEWRAIVSLPEIQTRGDYARAIPLW